MHISSSKSKKVIIPDSENIESKEDFVKYIIGQTGELYTANTILNNNLDFTELVFYKEAFQYTENKSLKQYTIDGERIIKNGRKFIEEDGVLIPKDNVVLNDIGRSIDNSTKRSKASFYNFGLNNDFQYFLTLTFSDEHVDRYDDEKVKYEYKKFRRKLQYINKNVKLLAGVERHKPNSEYPTGALHFHVLVGNIDLSPYMTLAVSPKSTNKLKCKAGIEMHNLTIFKTGLSTVVEFPKDYDRLRVVNYCIGYVSLENNIGYNKKRYFRTGNLNAGTKHIAFLSDMELREIMKLYKFEVYKDNNKMLVLRYKKHKEPGQLSFLKNDKRIKMTEINKIKKDPWKVKTKK